MFELYFERACRESMLAKINVVFYVRQACVSEEIMRSSEKFYMLKKIN